MTARFSTDLFRLASIKQAERHALSTRVVCHFTPNTPKIVQKYRECCCFSRDSEQFPLNTLNELGDLGLAFPCFFVLEQLLAIALVSMCVIAAVPNLIDNIVTNRKSERSASLALLAISSNDKGDEVPVWGVALHIVAMIGMWLALVATMWRLKKTVQRMRREAKNTQGDYSARVENLGLDWSEEELKTHIRSIMMNDTVTVVSVTAAYQLSALFKQRAENAKLLSASIEAKYRKLDTSEMSACAGVPEANSSLLPKTLMKSGIAFVSFASISEADDFKHRWAKSWLTYSLINKVHHSPKRHFNGRLMIITAAAEPSDVIWENLHIGRSVWVKRQCLTYSLLAGILVVSFFVLMYIGNMEQSLEARGHSSIERSLYGLPSSVLTILFNIVLEKTIRWLSAYEGHLSFTNQERATAYKLTLSKGLNTLLWPLITHLHRETWFTVGGLASNIFWLAIALAFANPLTSILLSPSVYYKALKRCYIRWKISHKGFVSQKTANSAFEYRDADIARWYTDLNVKFLFSLAYVSLMPIIVPITLTGLFVDYWVNKYILLRLAKRPRSLNERIAYVMVSLTKQGFLLYGVAVWFFYTSVESRLSIPCYIAIGFGVLFFVLPIDLVSQSTVRKSGSYTDETFVSNYRDEYRKVYEEDSQPEEPHKYADNVEFISAENEDLK